MDCVLLLSVLLLFLSLVLFTSFSLICRSLRYVRFGRSFVFFVPFFFRQKMYNTSNGLYGGVTYIFGVNDRRRERCHLNHFHYIPFRWTYARTISNWQIKQNINFVCCTNVYAYFAVSHRLKMPPAARRIYYILYLQIRMPICFKVNSNVYRIICTRLDVCVIYSMWTSIEQQRNCSVCILFDVYLCMYNGTWDSCA